MSHSVMTSLSTSGLVTDVVDEVDTKYGFDAGWAGATRGGAETVFGRTSAPKQGVAPAHPAFAASIARGSRRPLCG